MTTTSPSAGHPKPPFFRRTWVVAIVVAVLALVVGTVVGMRATDAKSSPEYKAQADRLATVESELAFAKASVGDAEETMANAEKTAGEAQDQLDKILGRLDERRAALKKRGIALSKAIRALDARKAKLKAKAADLREREDIITAAEEVLAVTTVPGDGSYEVGVDIAGGLYRSAGRAGCRYTVFGDAQGDEVLIDNTTAGAASVSLRTGTWFVTRGCADWTQ
jgi:uncharacterized coiled-coil protein SlyX